MLDDLLANEINVRIRKLPFKHIVIDNLFNKAFYQLICREFDERLKKGLVPKFNKNKFWKFGHYDAYCWSFDPVKDVAFSDTFYNIAWKQWVNKFFGLKLNNS